MIVLLHIIGKFTMGKFRAVGQLFIVDTYMSCP